MQAHYLQHVPFEGLGSIEGWLQSRNYRITATRFFERPKLPRLQSIDLLIVMGGPMSVNDEDQFPWLMQEKIFIRGAVERGLPVLGICLGAQLIASAMGAQVYPNAVKEIGWFPIHGIPGGVRSKFRFPPALDAFHWHGETFDLPADGICLARSEHCENQAFQLGRTVLGLQFHLETTPASAQDIVTHCRTELVPSPTVQSETAILTTPPEKYHAINHEMDRVLTFLTGNPHNPMR